jgi:hypothetical protein
MVANKPSLLAVGDASLQWRWAELQRLAEDSDVQAATLARMTPGELARALCAPSTRWAGRQAGWQAGRHDGCTRSAAHLMRRCGGNCQWSAPSSWGWQVMEAVPWLMRLILTAGASMMLP